MSAWKSKGVIGGDGSKSAHANDSRTSGNCAKASGALLVAMAAGLVLAGLSQGAFAANPTYAIVAPDEWNLPIVTSTTTFFFQTGIGQVTNKVWNQDGNKQSIPTTHLIAGISRVGQLFSIQAIPNTGFFWEALIPEVSVSGQGNSVSGFGDPLLDFTAYWKPTPQSTVGFQNIVSTTFGSNELSNHFWEYMPSFIGDVNIDKWELDGTLGAGFPSDQNSGGMVTEVGNMYFGEAAVTYHVNKTIAPFVNVNYQKNESSFNKTTGQQAAGLAPVFACAAPGGCHETIVGAGLRWNWLPTTWLTAWYTAGVDGRNTTRTNAIYFRIVQIF